MVHTYSSFHLTIASFSTLFGDPVKTVKECYAAGDLVCVDLKLYPSYRGTCAYMLLGELIVCAVLHNLQANAFLRNFVIPRQVSTQCEYC